ncbi:MAG: c-type cytochrome [Aeoliella sp.]
MNDGAGQLGTYRSVSSDQAGTRSPANRKSFHGGAYALIATELFILGAFFWAWLVYRQSYPGHSSSVADIVWCLIAVAGAGWGTLYLMLGWAAMGRGRLHTARELLAVALSSGVVTVGVLMVCVARAILSGPFLMDVSSFFDSRPEPVTESVIASAGDAAAGKKWFGMSCVTCHGPGGMGKANTAPSLLGSDFLKKSDGPVIAALIRTGRAISDPANKTGKVMPAKGGNPFLDETKIADLVAYLQDLENQSPSGEVVASTEEQVQLTSWVIPSPTSESLGIKLPTSNAFRTFSEIRHARAARRYGTSLSYLFVAASVVLAFHLIWVIGLAAAQIVQDQLGIAVQRPVRQLRQVLVFWNAGIVGLAMWFVMFVVIR